MFGWLLLLLFLFDCGFLTLVTFGTYETLLFLKWLPSMVTSMILQYSAQYLCFKNKSTLLCPVKFWNKLLDNKINTLTSSAGHILHCNYFAYSKMTWKEYVQQNNSKHLQISLELFVCTFPAIFNSSVRTKETPHNFIWTYFIPLLRDNLLIITL